MEPNIEELTREYNHACAWEVRHAIDSVTIPWDFETKNYLREQDTKFVSNCTIRTCASMPTLARTITLVLLSTRTIVSTKPFRKYSTT